MPLPTPGEDETEDEFISRCIPAVMNDDPDMPQDQAVAICYSQWKGETLTEKMHPDFLKIYNEFTSYYCKSKVPCESGDFEYSAWIKDLGLNDSKSYSKSQEAFQWAQDMITKYKEDEENTYWKILFAFPITSMNYNVYTEDEIEQSVKTILTNKGGSPSLNHWEDTRKEFQDGGVKYVGAEYEDGACEGILKVPNDFICPMCGEGKTLNSLIANKKIVNVSLEASCKTVGPNSSCIGLEFDPPTLLTVDTLPGIPLAKIFPLEKLMREAIGRPRKGKRKMEVKIVGLEQEKPPVVMPDDQGQCPEGMIYNAELGYCVSITPEALDCPEGQHWDIDAEACVPDLVHDPEGTVVALGTPAAGDSSTKPIEAMTEDELLAAISDIAAKIDKYYDDGIDTTEIEPLHAQMKAYQDALAALVRDKALTDEKYMKAIEQDIPQTGTSPAPAAEPSCPDGQIWDDELGRCVTPAAAPKVDTTPKVTDPSGQTGDPKTDPTGPLTGPSATTAPTVTVQPVSAALELKVSELQLITFQTEQKFKSAEEEIAYLKNLNKQLVVDKINLGASLQASQKEGERLQATIDKRDKSLIEKDKSIARMEMDHEKKHRDYEENLEKATERAEVTATSRDHYKTQLEENRKDYEALDNKYIELLDSSLAQTKKLTKSNEEKLDLEEKIAELRQKLKKMKRSAKVIVQM